MKKLFLYVFLILMWCNVVIAEKYILTCNNDAFLKVYSIDENTKTMIFLSSKSLNTDQEFNNLNQAIKIISWKNNIVNSLSPTSSGVFTYMTFYLKKKTMLQSGHYPDGNNIYSQKFKCIMG